MDRRIKLRIKCVIVGKKQGNCQLELGKEYIAIREYDISYGIQMEDGSVICRPKCYFNILGKGAKKKNGNKTNNASKSVRSKVKHDEK